MFDIHKSLLICNLRNCKIPEKQELKLIINTLIKAVAKWFFFGLHKYLMKSTSSFWLLVKYTTVLHGGKGMVEEKLGLCVTRKQWEGTITLTGLNSCSFSFSKKRCYLHSMWIFPPLSIITENTLRDSASPR